MTARFIKLTAAVITAASLAACGGGGSSSSSNTQNPGNQGGGNNGQQTVYTPSTATESATQTASACGSSSYAANTAGEWVMGFRGAAGTYSAARGVVCQNATLDSAALAVAQSVAQSTPMTLVQLRSQWEATYGGEIIDVQHDEHGLTAADCAEAANFKARSLYIQGRLNDVGAYSSQNQDGSFSCVLVAGTKAGTHGMGQRPATDSSAVVHLVSDGNYANRSGGLMTYIDVNFANSAVLDSCASDSARCLPAVINAVVGVSGPEPVADSMGPPDSWTAEAVDYASGNRLSILSAQVVDTSVDKKNSTIRYAFRVGCAGVDSCRINWDYTSASALKRLSIRYTDADRGVPAITVLPN